jgi:hypothetical protein
MVMSSRFGRSHHRIQNARMRAAPAQIAVKRFFHLLASQMGRAGQQRFCRQNYPTRAIAALRRLLVYERC